MSQSQCWWRQRIAQGRGKPLLTGILLLGLVVGACSTGAAEETTTTTEATAATTVADEPTTTAAPDEATTTEAPLDPVTVRVQLSPTVSSWLPIYVARDLGFFEEEGVDLQLDEQRLPTAQMLPNLLQGTVDILPVVAGPEIFNQHAQGFDIKLVSSVVEGHEGYHDNGWLMVEQGLWETDPPSEPADLEGLVIGGGSEGSPITLLAKQAMLLGGLERDTDVTLDLGYSGADLVAAFQNGSHDVIGMTEPLVSRLEDEGFGTRWVSYSDIMPWFQETYLATSAAYAEENPEAIERFLRAFLRGVEVIAAAEGEWTDDLIRIQAEYTGTDPEIVGNIAGVSYFGQFGEINTDSLQTQLDFWISDGLVQEAFPIEDIVDTGPLTRAQEAIGR